MVDEVGRSICLDATEVHWQALIGEPLLVAVVGVVVIFVVVIVVVAVSVSLPFKMWPPHVNLIFSKILSVRGYHLG